MIERPLKMTKMCERCTHQYGLWRPRCEACGLANKDREAACAAPVTQQRRGGATIAARVRARAKMGCIFCHAPGAKHTCTHCDEPIHRNCRGMHEPACESFQVERRRAEATLKGTT